MPRYGRYRGLPVSDYPELREALAPQLRNLPDEDVEALFESYNLSAEDMEGFLDTLKGIGKAVVSAAPAILPVAGTVVGTAFGGPVGAALGGALGRAAGGAIGQATAPRPLSAPGSRAIPGPVGPGGLPPGAQIPQVPQAPPGAAAASGQLLQTMFRPEVLQALFQMLLGQLGGSNVKVGSKPVPVDGFTNLLSTLANQAQAEYQAANATPYEGVPEYILGYAGEADADPAVAEHRAEVLYEMLLETNVEQVGPRWMSSSLPMAYGEADDEEEAYYYQLELAEYYDEDEF